jgi:thiol-disulfide isomerase/thioredoxin
MPMNAPLLRWIAFATLAVAALGAGLYFGQRADDAKVPDKEATALFAVALPDAQGREQSIGQWKGKVVVVNFWATWCAPCREEMPEFARIQTELGPKGVQFVGIAIDEAPKVKAFVDEIGLTYPALIGGYGSLELSKTLGNRLMALPFTVILDRSGHVAHTQLGPLPDGKLRTIVGQLL